MEFYIENTEVHGLSKALVASGNAMRTTMDSALVKDFDYWFTFGDFLVKFCKYYYEHPNTIELCDDKVSIELSDGKFYSTYEDLPHFIAGDEIPTFKMPVDPGESHNLLAVVKRLHLGMNLGNMPAGCGEDNYCNGIIVQFDMHAPLFMWKQIQRYHFLDFISSQSTMHKLTKFNVAEHCVSDTDPVILERFQQLFAEYSDFTAKSKEEQDDEKKKILAAEEKAKWRTLVASLPSGFVLGATMTTNYRQLKTMYFQRRNHKLKEWKAFCDWCLTLPLFKELCVDKEK